MQWVNEEEDAPISVPYPQAWLQWDMKLLDFEHSGHGILFIELFCYIKHFIFHLQQEVVHKL